MNNIKGVRTITVHNESNEKVVLDFNTFAEAARYFDDLYANAIEDNYAEEVLFPILLAAQNEEYDYIDEDGYAVIEQDATGIFEESCNKAIAEARPSDWEARAKSLVDDDFFVDFDEPLE